MKTLSIEKYLFKKKIKIINLIYLILFYLPLKKFYKKKKEKVPTVFNA